MARDAGSDDGERRPQLQIWEDEGREFPAGSFSDGEREWELLVVVESVAADLVRGRLSFRSGDDRYDTAPVLVDETRAGVVQRAAELPESMLRQLLISARE